MPAGDPMSDIKVCQRVCFETGVLCFINTPFFFGMWRGLIRDDAPY